ncbi:hypothetical protein AM587_10000452 [Phytophthora nicotianae]|nr:hypothetical protein AM587_10000619 [Phytophthora nicotianae]KUF99179.1 hypothetical protein AM587_10000452 [Phytophthora nicotianae]
MSPQVNTPVVAEVVHTPTPSVIQPVEASNVEVSKVPEQDESNVAPVVTESTVYGEEYNSDMKELNNSIDEYDSDDEDDFIPIKPVRAVETISVIKLVASNDSWMYETSDDDSSSDIESVAWDEHHQQILDDPSFEESECARYANEAAQGEAVDVEAPDAPKAPSKVNLLQSWRDNKEYDKRLFDLCTNFKVEWFQDLNNLWNLAGYLNRIPNGDHALLSKTYVCILKPKTGKLFNSKQSTKVLHQWAHPEYKFHPKHNETKLKQIANGHDPEGYGEWKAKYEPTLPPKEKTKINPNDVEFTDNCLLRIDKIARLNFVERDFLLEGINSVDTMLEEEWLDEYVAITSHPILGYNRT